MSDFLTSDTLPDKMVKVFTCKYIYLFIWHFYCIPRGSKNRKEVWRVMKRVRVLFVAIFGLVSFLIWEGTGISKESMGGEFALIVGSQVGPFKTDAGWYLAGEIGIPLLEIGPGRLLGLVNIGLAKNDDDFTFEPTVNALVPGALPTQVNVDLTTVTIVLGLKYKLLASPIIQPFVVAGPGIDIFLNDSDPGDVVGGIAPQPDPLRERGFPSGQGNAELGLHMGGGVDINLTERVFVGAEGRFNWVDRDNGAFATFGGRVGFRF
jgi:hypothetical protein